MVDMAGTSGDCTRGGGRRWTELGGNVSMYLGKFFELHFFSSPPFAFDLYHDSAGYVSKVFVQSLLSSTPNASLVLGESKPKGTDVEYFTLCCVRKAPSAYIPLDDNDRFTFLLRLLKPEGKQDWMRIVITVVAASMLPPVHFVPKQQAEVSVLLE